MVVYRDQLDWRPVLDIIVKSSSVAASVEGGDSGKKESMSSSLSRPSGASKPELVDCSRSLARRHEQTNKRFLDSARNDKKRGAKC